MRTSPNPPPQPNASRVSKNTRRRTLKIFWHFLILVFVVTLAYHFIEFDTFTRSLFAADLSSLVLLIAIATSDRFLMAAKWYHLLRIANASVGFLTVLRAYYEAAFVARITPIAMSSELLRAYTVARRCGAWSPVLGSMVTEKALAIISSSLLAALGSFMVMPYLVKEELAFLPVILSMLTVLSVVGVVLTMTDKFGSFAIRLVPSLKIKKTISKLHDAYALYSNHINHLIINLVLSISENMLQVALLFFAAISTGVEADPLNLLGILAISQLLRKLALILEGWMLGEAAVVITCSILGIDESQALAFSLLAGAVIIISTTPGMITLLLPSGKRTRTEIRREKLAEYEADQKL